ncbi:MAG: phosphoribosylanthranilate isomerase [Gammaproteobacteria bacterium]|nr:MAG: phosphoribosylanthranilate isomerase [Gammaproteobacteria bacterium]
MSRGSRVRTFIKICGLTTAEAVRAAVAAGADAVGFVFAASPRRVTPEDAAVLGALVPAGILRVAVMRHPLPEEWQEVAAVARPDWLQTDARDFAALQMPAGVGSLPVYRDVPGLDSAALEREDRALFEAAASGSGQMPDWDRARALARRTRLVLAGGLDPGNVGEVMRRARPWGVDVSSGVESGRGVKDPAKIEAFIAAVRRVERELNGADQ